MCWSRLGTGHDAACNAAANDDDAVDMTSWALALLDASADGANGADGADDGADLWWERWRQWTPRALAMTVIWGVCIGSRVLAQTSLTDCPGDGDDNDCRNETDDVGSDDGARADTDDDDDDACHGDSNNGSARHGAPHRRSHLMYCGRWKGGRLDASIRAWCIMSD